jgi:hypothetical protein
VVDHVGRTQHIEALDVAHAVSQIVELADDRLVVLKIHCESFAPGRSDPTQTEVPGEDACDLP